MLHAVIMAGGSGTRFWPASRAARPKQLLDLAGERTMIQATCDRLDSLVPAERVLVVTNRQLVDPIRNQLPDLPQDSIIGEPCKRDTAPCIGLAAALLLKQDAEATMLVMPADHVIRPVEAFQAAVRHAVDLLEEDERRIITFGITPTYPAQIFGYIERDAPLGEDGVLDTYSVRKFEEKPGKENAQAFFESGRHYWNSGIFVWRARTIVDALKKHEPSMAEHLDNIAATVGTPEFGETLERDFSAITGKSIDYAVMEHYQPVVVVEAPFHWDDVGSWRSLERLQSQDENGNTCQGRTLALDSKNCIIRSEGSHLVATVGMEDVIVVHTADATLVIPKDNEEAVRAIVSELEARGADAYL